MLELRPYQRTSLDALYDYWSKGGGNGLIVLPTGAGKALVLAKLIEELLADYPDMRIVNLTHSKNLVEQNFKEFVGLAPFAPAGLYSAGLGRRDRHAQVLFAGIQSVANKTAEIGHIDLTIVDEAHAISRKADTQYGQYFDGVREMNPEARVVGLTATDYRMDSGRLTEGDDKLFDDVVYEAKLRDLIDEGYLAPLTSKAVDVMIDLGGVGKRGGEYIAGQLERAADKEEITRAAVQQAIRLGQNRKAWLFFCSGQDHSEHVRDELLAQGIPAASLTSRTKGQDAIIRDFKSGKLRALCSANMLTTGFNVPQVDLISMLRPTASVGLYVQICGRGTRKAPGKENCLVLDHAGNVTRHGPVDAVEPKAPGKGDGDAPVRICDQCEEICHASAKVCPCCGNEFPLSEVVKITARPSDAPILSTTEPIWREVTGRTFREHVGKSGPCVRIDYMMGMEVQKDFVGPESVGFFKQKSDRLWKSHGGKVPYPSTVAEFLDRADELAITTDVEVRKNGKYWNVVNWKAGEHGQPSEVFRPSGGNLSRFKPSANDNEKARLRSVVGQDWSGDIIPF